MQLKYDPLKIFDLLRYLENTGLNLFLRAGFNLEPANNFELNFLESVGGQTS